MFLQLGKSYLFYNFIYKLAWEPSFAWRINFRFKSKPTQLGIFTRANTIFLVLSSYTIKIWGKSVKVLMSLQTEITTFIDIHHFLYRQIIFGKKIDW